MARTLPLHALPKFKSVFPIYDTFTSIATVTDGACMAGWASNFESSSGSGFVALKSNREIKSHIDNHVRVHLTKIGTKKGWPSKERISTHKLTNHDN